MKISRKAELMPSSAIRKLMPYAEEAKKKGIKVHHLNIGQPDLDSPKEALDAVKNNHLKVLKYSSSGGRQTLREGLVKYYKNIGIELKPENINITNGGSEALQLALAVTCNPEDEVIVFEPFYTNYNAFALQNDVKLHPITTTIENGFELPPMSEVEKHINRNTKGIIICNPGNPTGNLYTKKDLLELGKICKKNNLYIYSDEVYREFCYTKEPHFSSMQIPGLENNVILIDSVSKRYSLCGARIGFIVSKNMMVMNAVMKYAQARLCSGTYGQIASEGALQASPEYFKKSKDEYILRRNVVMEGLKKIPGIVCPTPMGAFYAAVQLPIDNSEKFAQWLLEDFEYEKQTVMVAPMAGFYATKGLGKQQVRIAYVINCNEIKAALKCLSVALKKYPGRTKF